MLGREAPERATKSREVFVRRVLNKQDEGLFRKSTGSYEKFGQRQPLLRWSRFATLTLSYALVLHLNLTLRLEINLRARAMIRIRVSLGFRVRV